MKTFLYYRVTLNKNRVYMKVYRIHRGNRLGFVGDKLDDYTDPAKLCMNILEGKKALPKRAFVKRGNGAYFHDFGSLAEEGIARIYSL